MTKRITILFLLLALAVGYYAMTAKAKGDSAGGEDPTRTAQPSQTATTATPGTCRIYTGVDGGTVNLRTCGGTSCAVISVLSEGASLDIVQAGAWLNVTTEDGVTGYINSNFCK
jgi:SH3-like domain-containing protein